MILWSLHGYNCLKERKKISFLLFIQQKNKFILARKYFKKITTTTTTTLFYYLPLEDCIYIYFLLLVQFIEAFFIF